MSLFDATSVSSRVLSDYDYGWVLSDPGIVGVLLDEQRPLPVLAEPDVFPLVVDPVSELLVPVEHRLVRSLGSYWHAGWPSACPDVLLRSGVAERLYLAAESLPSGFGLAVLDAWRPLELQHDIYVAAYADPLLPPGFVSVPSEDPRTPPPHLTGGTVDVTLTWRGHALRLGTDFDCFSDAAFAAAFEEVDCLVRELRRLLFWAMHRAGFVVIDCEWWHYEFGTRRWAALCGETPLYGPVFPV